MKIPNQQRDPGPPPAEVAAPLTARFNGFTTVLVVDDDAESRRLAVKILFNQGYTVLQADGPVEAMRLAGTTENIHLLLTDFSMPEANGLVLARQFRTAHPTTPVLMVSGSVKLFDGKVDDLDRFALLEKPFTSGDLMKKVRALLTEILPPPSGPH